MLTESRQTTRRREAIMQAVGAEAYVVLAESGQLVLLAQELYERVTKLLDEEVEAQLPITNSLPITTR